MNTEYEQWKQEHTQAYQKVKAFVESILDQCHNQGFTISNARWIARELNRQVESSIQHREESEVFFK